MTDENNARRNVRPTNAAGEAIFNFWFVESKPYQWFRRDRKFDQTIKQRFGALHKAATLGHLDAWRAHPRFSLSLIILLDQFSRNMFRDDPRTFAHDAQALDIAREAIRRRFDRIVEAKRRSFFYMPFMHAESLSVQRESVALFKARLPGTMNMPFAIEHFEIIRRFGRFPHRNKIFGRVSSPAEIASLKAGGFNP